MSCTRGSGKRRPPWFGCLIAVPAVALSACTSPAPGTPEAVDFERAQPELFGTPGAWTNSWVDFDGDSDLDLFVGMRFVPNRL